MEKKESPRIEEKPAEKKKTEKKPAHKPQAPAAKPAAQVAADANFRQLVRVSGVVLDGNKTILRVLPTISGIGHNTGVALLKSMGIKSDVKLGSLTEEEVAKLEEGIKTMSNKIPVWMQNRRRDYETGANLHLTGSELEIAQREDITRHKRIKSYKGIRHIMGLPVRGQRTRTSFRTGTALGVSRKKTAQAAAAAAKATAGGGGKGAAAAKAAEKK